MAEARECITSDTHVWLRTLSARLLILLLGNRGQVSFQSRQSPPVTLRAHPTFAFNGLASNGRQEEPG